MKDKNGVALPPDKVGCGYKAKGQECPFGDGSGKDCKFSHKPEDIKKRKEHIEKLAAAKGQPEAKAKAKAKSGKGKGQGKAGAAALSDDEAAASEEVEAVSEEAVDCENGCPCVGAEDVDEIDDDYWAEYWEQHNDE